MLGCRRQEDRDRAWSSRESAAMKRDALLDCLDTAQECYRHAWARTSVDIAIQASASPACHSMLAVCTCELTLINGTRLQTNGPSAL